ncbi:MAG: hypothetical protein ABL901_12850 [Hyphomicrobiaceae bacterium]
MRYFFFAFACFGLLQWSAASAADISFNNLNGQSWRCYNVGHPSHGGKPCASNSVKRLDAVADAAGVTFTDDNGRSASGAQKHPGDKNLFVASWDCSINLRDGLDENSTVDGGLKNPIVLYFFHGDKCAFKNQAWVSTKLTQKELKRLEKASKEAEW